MKSMWKLNKYARFVQSDVSAMVTKEEKAEWEYFDNTPFPLKLTLADRGHLLVSHGLTIMESYNLTMSQKYLRGQSKGDTMIIFYHMQDVSHRFRIKFAASELKTSHEVCRECAEKMAKYFPVKAIVTTEAVNLENPSNKTTLRGEVTLSDLANVVTGTSKNQLPSVYNNMPTDTTDIGVLLKLCLSDPSFPAYVEQVEKELDNLALNTNS
ncbi:meiotic recombination protein REC114-like [Mytilus galloprovincialis]|uniref:meiotic recombination protein REC114-like n=1 Tax=Mytilus galloprovincialis TaxID=29158 RepID=UPI003F7C3F77